MWLLITGSLIVGTIAKKAIYSHIFKTKISEQPINILILSEHLVRHACSIVLLASLSISLMFDGSIRQMIERFDLMKSTSYCWFYHYAGTFMVVYLNQNGLGIAIVRLLYIKKGTWLKNTFGEMKLMKIMKICVISSALVLTHLFAIENNPQRTAFNMCMGHTEKFQVGSVLTRRLANVKAC